MLSRSSKNLCQEVQCNKISVSSPTRSNKIFKTEIEVKKRVLCHHFGTSWLICILCQKRFSLKHKKYAKQHFSTFHSIQSPPYKTPTLTTTNVCEINFNNDCISSISILSHEVTNTNNTKQNIQFPSLHQHIDHLKHDLKHADMSEVDKAYFTAEIDMPNKGLQKLVSKSVLHSSIMVPSNAETLYHLDVAKFCNGLNGAQQAHFARIMKKTCQNDIFTVKCPPQSMQDIHSLYTRSKTLIKWSKL